MADSSAGPSDMPLQDSGVPWETMRAYRVWAASRIDALFDDEDFPRARTECLQELSDPTLPWYFRYRYNLILSGIAFSSEKLYDAQRLLEEASHALGIMEDGTTGSESLREMRDAVEQMQVNLNAEMAKHNPNVDDSSPLSSLASKTPSLPSGDEVTGTGKEPSTEAAKASAGRGDETPEDEEPAKATVPERDNDSSGGEDSAEEEDMEGVGTEEEQEEEEQDEEEQDEEEQDEEEEDEEEEDEEEEGGGGAGKRSPSQESAESSERGTPRAPRKDEFKTAQEISVEREAEKKAREEAEAARPKTPEGAAGSYQPGGVDSPD